MSKITPLPNIHWSPKAALVDLLEEADDIESMVVLYWSKSDDILHAQAANLTSESLLWMLEQKKKSVLDGG